MQTPPPGRAGRPLPHFRNTGRAKCRGTSVSKSPRLRLLALTLLFAVFELANLRLESLTLNSTIAHFAASSDSVAVEPPAWPGVLSKARLPRGNKASLRGPMR